jgi:hypothetical protein
MSDLLQVESLSAGYGEAVVLQGVSFSLAMRARPWRCWGAMARARPP